MTTEVTHAERSEMLFNLLDLLAALRVIVQHNSSLNVPAREEMAACIDDMLLDMRRMTQEHERGIGLHMIAQTANESLIALDKVYYDRITDVLKHLTAIVRQHQEHIEQKGSFSVRINEITRWLMTLETDAKTGIPPDAGEVAAKYSEISNLLYGMNLLLERYKEQVHTINT